MDEITRIRQAQTNSELLVLKQASLHTIKNEIQQKGLQTLEMQVDIEEKAMHISSIHDAICYRIMELEWDRLNHSSESPFKYEQLHQTACWVRLGSAARNEATFCPDQDHMCIYQFDRLYSDGNVASMYRNWMEGVVDSLLALGYPYCKGFVMATNPRWHGMIDDFMDRMDQYLSYPTWEHVRYVMLLLDMRCMFGTNTWVASLRSACIDRVKKSPFLLWKVVDGGWTRSDGIRFLGQLRLVDHGPYRGLFPLKESLYFPLVNSIRLWAVAYGIDETSSWSRSRKLYEDGVWNRQQLKDVLDALNVYYKLRIFRQMELQQQSSQQFEDEDLYIDLDSIGKQCEQQIQQALIAVYALHKRTTAHFRKPR